VAGVSNAETAPGSGSEPSAVGATERCWLNHGYARNYTSSELICSAWVHVAAHSGERRKLKERGIPVQEQVQPLARQQLAPLVEFG
jgi:hypothetical protein